MRRTVAVIWHASFSIAAGVLYFFFVLPRMPELLGNTSHTLGTALRIVTGALIGLAALPVVFTLLRTRRPEFGTPALALALRKSSVGLHVLAGALIVGAAIGEIWLSLDSAGQWLFGIYGAAAAIALLGVFAFYLAFVAELPPPPPKPLKVKMRKGRRGRKDARGASDNEAETAEVSEEVETPEAIEESEAVEETAEEPVPTAETNSEPEIAAETDPQDSANSGADEAAAFPGGKLQNRRPTGKGTVLGRRRRSRGGVAVED